MKYRVLLTGIALSLGTEQAVAVTCICDCPVRGSYYQAVVTSCGQCSDLNGSAWVSSGTGAAERCSLSECQTTLAAPAGTACSAPQASPTPIRLMDRITDASPLEGDSQQSSTTEIPRLMERVPEEQ